MQTAATQRDTLTRKCKSKEFEDSDSQSDYELTSPTGNVGKRLRLQNRLRKGEDQIQVLINEFQLDV
jgi:hypothetical protein